MHCQQQHCIIPVGGQGSEEEDLYRGDGELGILVFIRTGGRDYQNQHMVRGLPMHRGNVRMLAGAQGGRGVSLGSGNARPMACFTCGVMGMCRRSVLLWIGVSGILS